MRTVFRRETFIALRARRQGHRIASEILNPHIDDERLPDEPKTPIKVTLPPLVQVELQPQVRWMLLVFVAVLAALIISVCIVLYGPS